MGVNEDMGALTEILQCPNCHQLLELGTSEFRCCACGRQFPCHERVPKFGHSQENDQERTLVSRLHYALLGNPRVYDFQQAHFGAKPVVSRLRRELADIHDATVLDLGAGTGVVAGLLPEGNRYVWLDNDTQKLRGLISRGEECFAVLADAARLPIRDRVADVTLMVEVSHHLPETALGACLEEAARVTRGRFVFVDAVRGPRVRSRLAWKLDLGRYPRPETEIVAALAGGFSVERIERFRGVNHDHVMCVCAPRLAAQRPCEGT